MVRQCCVRELRWILRDAYTDPAPDYYICSNGLTRLVNLDLTKNSLSFC